MLSYYICRSYENLGMIDKSLEIINMIESITGNQIKSLNSLIIILEKLFLLDKQKLYPDQTPLFDKGMELLMDIVENKETKRWIGLFNLVQANNYVDKGQYELAQEHYKNGIQLFTQSKAANELAFTLNLLANTYQSKGEIDQSLDYYLKSLKIYQRLGLKDRILRLYNNIGIIYINKGMIDLALEFFNKTLEFNINKNNLELISTCYNNIGIIYFYKGELNTAIEYYQKALHIYQQSENKIDIATAYINIGEVYLHKEDIQTALKYFMDCLDIYEKLNNPILITEAYFDLLKVSIHEGNIGEAESYLNKMKKINSERTTDLLSLKIKLAEALILQENVNMNQKAKAKDLFLSIISSTIIEYEIYLTAFLNYCNLLINEFKISLDIEILHELKKRIQYLIEISNENNLYLILIESYILASKVAVIEGNYEYADQIINQGIMKATEKKLSGLLTKIESYREEFLKEKTKGTNSSTVKERLEQSSMVDYIRRLRRKIN